MSNMGTVIDGQTDGGHDVDNTDGINDNAQGLHAAQNFDNTGSHIRSNQKSRCWTGQSEKDNDTNGQDSQANIQEQFALNDLETFNGNELVGVWEPTGRQVVPACYQFACIIHGVNLAISIINDIPTVQFRESNVFQMNTNGINFCFFVIEGHILGVFRSGRSEGNIILHELNKLCFRGGPPVGSQSDIEGASFSVQVIAQTSHDILVSFF
mmetsp:Transcript_4529/g.9672  ORF Transcript_4529/g.9672 Transcript_4529/m.9672 type:complete len:211 (-) Transcript_4529:382-1014(-)